MSDNAEKRIYSTTKHIATAEPSASALYLSQIV